MKTLLWLVVLLFLVLLLGWIGLGYYAHQVDPRAYELLNTYQVVGRLAWNFGQPLLQLVVVLVVLEWFFTRNQIKLSFTQLGIVWDARLLVALIIILTFCLTALSGIPDNGIKEAALVVIGFYFGTLHKRDQEPDKATSGAVASTPKNEAKA